MIWLSAPSVGLGKPVKIFLLSHRTPELFTIHFTAAHKSSATKKSAAKSKSERKTDEVGGAAAGSELSSLASMEI